MPLTDLQLITVKARYLRFDGNPASGTVTLKPSTVLVNTAANEIITPTNFTSILDLEGRVQFLVPATNDPDVSPVGFTYTVTETIDNQLLRAAWELSVPFDSPGLEIDLADVAPSVPVTPTSPYLLASQKGAADGVAELDSTTKVPTIRLGGAGADGTKILWGDRTWRDAPSPGNDLTVKDNGTTVGTRPALNVIEGTDITTTLTDDPTNDEVELVIGITPGAFQTIFFQNTAPTGAEVILNSLWVDLDDPLRPWYRWDGTTWRIQNKREEVFGVSLSTWDAAVTAGVKEVFHMPFAMTVTSAYAELATASTYAGVQEIQSVDIPNTGAREVQSIDIPDNVTSGTFTLTFDGNTTSALQWNSTAAQVATALNALTSITNAGGVTASGGPLPGTAISVTFTNPGPRNAITGDGTNLTPGGSTVTVTETTAGVAGTVSGTFTLTWEGQTTAGIAWNATAAQVASALNALSGVTAAGGVTASAGPLPDSAVNVIWTAVGPRSAMTGSGTGLSSPGTVTIVEVTPGVTDKVTADVAVGAGLGSSIFTTKPGIDRNEFDSRNGVPAVIGTANIASGARVTCSCVDPGVGAKGLKVWLNGYRTTD